MKNIPLEVVEHYGILHQLKYLQSEIYELNEAIIECECYRKTAMPSLRIDEKNLRHIEEEFADVSFMLKQIKEYYKLDDKRLNDWEEYKGNRQLRRIENEQN